MCDKFDGLLYGFTNKFEDMITLFSETLQELEHTKTLIETMKEAMNKAK